MPNCFQLIPVGQTEPAILQRVDEAICAHMGQPVDPVHWFNGWYDWIGFLLACGKSFDDIEALTLDQRRKAETDEGKLYWNNMEQVLMFVRANYTSDAFWEPKS